MCKSNVHPAKVENPTLVYGDIWLSFLEGAVAAADRLVVVVVGHFQVGVEECCQREEEVVDCQKIVVAEHLIQYHSAPEEQQDQEVRPCFLGIQSHIQV